jgi:hypothetical protein
MTGRTGSGRRKTLWSPRSGVQVNIPHGTAYGLEDPMRAEVHLVLLADA